MDHFDRQLPRGNHLDGFRRVWCHGVVWRSLRLLRDFVFRDGLPVDSCYTLTVNDSYGDGICCGYGQGSFELSSGGEVLVSGGEFGSTVSLDFCLESLKFWGAPIQTRRTTIRRPLWTTGLYCCSPGLHHAHGLQL